MNVEIEEIVFGKRQRAFKWPIEVMAGALVGLKEIGEPINMGYLNIHYPSLRQAIQRYPGGWVKVVSYAGYEPLEEAKKGTIRARLARMKRNQ